MDRIVRLSPGGIYVDDQQLSFDQVAQSEIFNDFYRPMGIGHGMGANLLADGRRTSILSLHRNLQDGGFRPEEVDPTSPISWP
jgi:hypothetical protein